MRKRIPDDLVFDSPYDFEDHFDIAMVRERPYWEHANGVPGASIQLGAGMKTIDGWENLEYPQWNADMYMPAPGYSAEYYLDYGMENIDKLKYVRDDESVRRIATYHTLDHLTPDQVIHSLQEFQRVLSPGGVITNIVPHYMSQLANECIQHRSRFAIDTFRNIFSERQYKQFEEFDWNLRVGYNMVMGLTERNLVLVTQLIKD